MLSQANTVGNTIIRMKLIARAGTLRTHKNSNGSHLFLEGSMPALADILSIHNTLQTRSLRSIPTRSRNNDQKLTGSIPPPAPGPGISSTRIRLITSITFPKTMAENCPTHKALIRNSSKPNLAAQHCTQNRPRVLAQRCTVFPYLVVRPVLSRSLLPASITVTTRMEGFHQAAPSLKHTMVPTNQSPLCPRP